MKKQILFYGLILITQILSAQALYKCIGKSKSDIKKDLSTIELVRDWGKGESMDMEEPGPNMLKFRFDKNDICISVNFMSFSPKPERVKAEQDAITADNWKLDQNWKTDRFDNHRFKKGEKIFRMKNSSNQVFEIGYEEGLKWPPTPEELAKQKSEPMKPIILNTQEKNTAITKEFGGIMVEIIKKGENTFTGRLTGGQVDFKVGATGDVSDITYSGNSSLTIWLGAVKVQAVTGTEVVFAIIKDMGLQIDGKKVDVFKMNKEVHFVTNLNSTSTKETEKANKKAEDLAYLSNLSKPKEAPSDAKEKTQKTETPLTNKVEQHKTYHDNGKLKEDGEYVNNEDGQYRNGKWTLYWDNGQVREVTNYKMNKKQGDCSSFRLNGTKLFEEHYENGELDGTIKYFHPDNKPKDIYIYDEGKRNGPYKGYNFHGYLEDTGTYLDNKKHGKWQSFNKDGTVSKTKQYDMGQLIPE